MELSTATAFWSYAHADNDATGGHVRDLAKQVEGAYLLETGEKLTLFVDRDEESGLKWGDEWQQKINSTIAGTTFFIPIISASYLNSDNCRAEFLDFWSRAKESNLGELLLPIVYADVDLSDETEDEICQIVKQIQFLDWRDVRLEDESSSVYKRALAKIGRRLKAIAKDVEAKPEQIPAASRLKPAEADDADADADDEFDDDTDEPGLFEALELAEIAITDSGDDMSAITSEFAKIGSIFNTAPRLGDLNSNTDRLALIKDLAKRIDPPATEFLSACRRFEFKLREVDRGLDSLIEFSQSPMVIKTAEPSIRKVNEQFVEMRDTIQNEVVSQLPEFREVFTVMSRMSRDFKKPANKIKKAFTVLESAINIIAGWADSTRLPLATDQA